MGEQLEGQRGECSGGGVRPPGFLVYWLIKWRWEEKQPSPQ